MSGEGKAETPEPECEHAFRGMDTSARIATPCPACGRSSLFVGKGGWLTCSRTACRAPGAINDAAQDVAAAEARGRAQGQREGREAERADVVAWLWERMDGALPAWLTSAIKGGEHLGAAERKEQAPPTP